MRRHKTSSCSSSAPLPSNVKRCFGGWIERVVDTVRIASVIKTAAPGSSFIKPPTFSEPGEFRPSLIPADNRCVRQFLQTAAARAIGQVSPHVVQPAQQHGSGPVYLSRRMVPHGGQRLGFPKSAFVSLCRAIIMGMHHDRFRAIDYLVSLRAAPAGVFVVLGVLHLIQKA